MSRRKHNVTPHTRQQKKEHFQSAHGESASKSHTAVLIAVIVVLSIAALYLFLSSRPGEGAFTAPYATLGGQYKAIGAPGQDVQIPIAEVNDGVAKFYNYTLPSNQTISFFVIKSSDGVIRAAFNACDVCYPQRLGYHQEGNDMICNKCKRHFPSASVNEVQGGCNPSPLKRAVEGDHLVIKAEDLQQGAFYF